MGWTRNSYFGHDVRLASVPLFPLFFLSSSKWNKGFDSVDFGQVVAHSGGIPGISTRISFLPSDGLGIIILVNSDDKSSVTNIPITQRIIHDMLDVTLDSVEGRTGQMKSERWSSQEPIDISLRSSDISVAQVVNEDEPDISLEAYTGTYNNSGYGSFTLCASSSTSDYCTEVLSNFTTVDSHIPSSRSASSARYRARNSAKELYASFPRVWASHLRFVHLEGQKFIIEATNLFPEGYGKDKSPFEAMADDDTSGVIVEFVVGDENDDAKGVKGFGMVGLIEGKTARTKRVGGSSVQDRADVWFDRADQ